MRINSFKCAFRVFSGKFLGFLVRHRGIDLDPTKAKAIAALNPPYDFERVKKLYEKSSLLKKIYSGFSQNSKALGGAD